VLIAVSLSLSVYWGARCECHSMIRTGFSIFVKWRSTETEV
jgi:hypothetical protein